MVESQAQWRDQVPWDCCKFNELVANCSLRGQTLCPSLATTWTCVLPGWAAPRNVLRGSQSSR